MSETVTTKSPDPVFYAEDAEGVLRRWRPSPEMHCSQAMANAIRNGNATNDTAALINFLADRLVMKGDSENMDFIVAARHCAKRLHDSLPKA